MYNILFFILCFPFFGRTQQVVAEFILPKEAKWTVNGKGDVLYVENDAIVLLANDGRVLKQSSKAYGTIEQFQNINSLKSVLFSSEQQVICFIDNSLTNIDQCLDLDDLGFTFVTKIAASSQSDKIWIYDEVNSNLTLYSVLTQMQTQAVANLRGLLSISEVTQIVEYNNNLIVIDRNKGLYFFDRFGTFEYFSDVKEVEHIEVVGKHLVLLKDQKLFEFSVELDGTQSLIDMGFQDITNFRYNGESLFIQKQNKIQKIRF